MGAIYSLLRDAYLGIRAAILTIQELNTTYGNLLKRIALDPGFPVPKSTSSFWLDNPPFPELVNKQSIDLPETADVVIIGSGITGASIARTILEESAAMGLPNLKVVVLEARELSSGATGRNGGHIKTSPYMTFSRMKNKLGIERAREIVRFEMQALPILTGMAVDEKLEEAEARVVETVDLFYDEEAWEKGKKMARELESGMPEVASGMTVWSAAEARERFGTSHLIRGAISYDAGALWPYRLVASIFSNLVKKYTANLSIETRTVVENISTLNDTQTPFLVETSRGDIATSHVIHATNAHAASLVPGLRGKLFPVRGQMSAQRPGKLFPKFDGNRSWSFIARKGFEYVTQRPGLPDYEDGMGGEIMIGGGLMQSSSKGLDEIGIPSDNEINFYTGSHLNGVLPMAFGLENWGSDHPSGRLKKMWTGSIGFTADGLPFVGKLDSVLTKREVPETLETSEESRIGRSAEWISAGYNGEGMVYAWLCGVAVGLMVLDRDKVESKASPGRLPGTVEDWLPKELIVTAQRVARANVNELADEL
ncbi:FAD dependent oxidoreductase-domain-containing protein [Xylogone sp. PMI_703]|nr:FAD dependent oxidoreductase-domain-containing protein [Xylogone sp. PMI_703]